MHAFRKSGFKGFEFLFDIVNNLEGVFTITHDNNAADSFTVAVKIGCAAPKFRADAYLGKIFYKYRCSLFVAADYNLFDILDRLDVTKTAYHEFCLAHFNKAAADIVVAFLDGGSYLGNGNVVCEKAIRVNGYLILFYIAAYARNFRNTFDCRQFIAKIPVLD